MTASPAGQDYSCTAADQSAVLAATVPEPAGSAVLVQTISADDYRGTAVTFRGQLRATGMAGQAGLHLAERARADDRRPRCATTRQQPDRPGQQRLDLA